MITYSIFLNPEKTESLAAEADFYSAGDCAPTSLKHKTVLYFHGGGLLCGSRRDLPEIYRNMFLNAGYDFLALDYLLAPEHSLTEIEESCCTVVKWFLKHCQDTLGLDSSEYILFGRSSGAYLALQTAFQAITRNKEDSFSPPSSLLLFYGYPGLTEEAFLKGNSYYRSSYPTVSREEAFLSIQNFKDFDTVKSPRTLLYLYARQTGEWLNLIGKEEEWERFSLSDQELSLLPPAFLTASSMDQDVPFGISKAMARKIPGSRFYPVYNLEHDFDQNTSLPEGRQAYKECLQWLDSFSIL